MFGNRKSQHSFAQVPDVRTSRSTFNRSYARKTTFNFDYLVPFMVQEIIPGDTMNLTMRAFARLSTQKFPIMDNAFIDYLFFFCPNRLVFDNFKKMMGEQTNPGDSTDYIFPQMTSTGSFSVGSIYDYYGLPTDVNNITIKNTLPLRMYPKIWNDWFRDQNLDNSQTVPTDDGPDAEGDFGLLKSNKAHDYFTSCLPWPQKGDAVLLPLGQTAPVLGIGKETGTFTDVNRTVRESDQTTTVYPLGMRIDPGASDNTFYIRGTGGTNAWPQIYADLTNATAATINQLREAFAVQSILELDARGGTRYTEILMSHFNVFNGDATLQRPEFLGSGRSYINSHPVPQTSPTSGANAQAQLASFATSSVRKEDRIGFTKSFVEHGYVIGLMRARADLTYQQGIPKTFMRSTRLDLYWPKMQELGEQAVMLGELYAQGTSADYDTVFGYQERFAEYRYAPSEITGEFRSTYATSLDAWHLAEEFSSAPSLNATFMKSNTPIERSLAVTDGPDILMDMFFDLIHVRPMVSYPTPANLGRF